MGVDFWVVLLRIGRRSGDMWTGREGRRRRAEWGVVCLGLVFVFSGFVLLCIVVSV